MKKKAQIELRSEEVQEVMNHVPPAVVRYGITILFIILMLLIAGSYWFKYPDVISAEITLSTQTPPIYIIARATGRMDCIYAKDTQCVTAGTVLGVIDNAAVTDDVMKVQAYLDKWLNNGCGRDSFACFFLSTPLQLGEVQPAYATFISALNLYLRFYEQKYHEFRIRSEEELLQTQKKYGEQLNEQYQLSELTAILQRKIYQRDSILFHLNAITAADFDETEKIFLQNKQTLVSSKLALIQNDMQNKQAVNNLMAIKQQALQEEDDIQMTLKNASEQLYTQLMNWQQRYLLQSPIDGKVTLMSAWSKHQNVESGETVFVVSPLKESNPIGKALLPVQGSGKVQVGQQVNIRLNNYPDQEFGYVSGFVNNISPLPTAEDVYVVDISLPNGLLTNYQKALPLAREMKGTADIITADISLIERFIQPIRKIVKEKF